jgi:hypothetical protein
MQHYTVELFRLEVVHSRSAKYLDQACCVSWEQTPHAMLLVSEHETEVISISWQCALFTELKRTGRKEPFDFLNMNYISDCCDFQKQNYTLHKYSNNI